MVAIDLGGCFPSLPGGEGSKNSSLSLPGKALVLTQQATAINILILCEMGVLSV